MPHRPTSRIAPARLAAPILLYCLATNNTLPRTPHALRLRAFTTAPPPVAALVANFLPNRGAADLREAYRERDASRLREREAERAPYGEIASRPRMQVEDEILVTEALLRTPLTFDNKELIKGFIGSDVQSPQQLLEGFESRDELNKRLQPTFYLITTLVPTAIYCLLFRKLFPLVDVTDVVSLLLVFMFSACA
jgi:hypothetical protein